MLGFGVHPIQQACGQAEISDSGSALKSSFLLQSDFKQMIENFDHVADANASEAEEGVEA